MRIIAMKNWERPIRIAVIMVMALTLLSPLGSVVFADDGTEGEPPVTEESEPPPEEESEGETPDPADTPPVEDTEPVADEVDIEEDAEPVADEVAIEDETCPVDDVDTAAEASDAGESSIVIDPYFFIGGVEIQYASIQAAINYLSANGLTPDDGLIIVEDGILDEDVTIDGNAWLLGPTPSELILQSENGSGATVIDGTVIIQNMLDFVLNGFEVTEGVEAISNTGTLIIEDVVATNPDGDAIAVVNHTGDVEITNVNASNAANGTVGDNIGNGVFVFANPGSSVSLTNVTANGNEESGALIVFHGDDETNVITVTDSIFNENGQYGVWAQPEDGTVTFSCVKASANAAGAIMVPVGEEMIWIKCEAEGEDKEDEYEDCIIDDKSGQYVNVGDGMMVEFPPIDPIVDADASYASYYVIDKSKQLPADLPEGDTFMVGIDILIYNAEIPEGETIKIEFFIAGYQWEENFAVLWFDEDAAEWVEVPFTKEPHERIPGGKIVAEWDQPGTFVLVLRSEVVSDS